MSPSEPREPTVEEIIAGVASYYWGERELYVRHSEPLDPALRAPVARYFSAELLDKELTKTLNSKLRLEMTSSITAGLAAASAFERFARIAGTARAVRVWRLLRYGPVGAKRGLRRSGPARDRRCRVQILFRFAPPVVKRTKGGPRNCVLLAFRAVHSLVNL